MGKDINIKFRKIRKLLAPTRQAFSEISGLPQKIIEELEEGQREFDTEILMVLVNRVKLNLNYLLGTDDLPFTDARMNELYKQDITLSKTRLKGSLVQGSSNDLSKVEIKIDNLSINYIFENNSKKPTDD